MQLRIDKNSVVPIADQLITQVTLCIRYEELQPGEQLPTVRELADRLKLNHNTVASAYRALEQKGYVVQNRRAGTRVASRPPKDPADELLAHVTATMTPRLVALEAKPNDVLKLLAAHLALGGRAAPITVAVLARTPLAAAQAAARTQAILGDPYLCVPQTPAEYRSFDYQLSVVDPELVTPLAEVSPQGVAPVPTVEIYSAAFPAGAD